MRGFTEQHACWTADALRPIAPHVFTSRQHPVSTPRDLRPLLSDTVERVVMSRQVHGNAVTLPDHRPDAADAHVSDDPAVAVAVKTADCVPLLLAADDGRAVAAVHAGWRGLDPDVGVVGRAARALYELAQVEPHQVVAVIGPCISGARYEVGPEVGERFGPPHSEALSPSPSDDARQLLDLRAVATRQLLDAGLARASITVVPACTFDQPTRWFSYRREGPGVGHQYAAIAPRPR
ncbi:MAG: polyphenol oxidase family protein [Planctomycetota bacterium]